ncbi:MAG TPA: CHAT domain-containing tetratricopeptide repeat protein, partial [Ohtaekwangia sp.]|nr:CHAT domain-containing tetratricopeptide repeat protein [Ohtaekwangia sp.]
QRTEGRQSSYCITLQSNIAGIQLKQGEIKQAIASFEGIQSDLSGLIPESNPFYITVLNNLASAYRKDGQYQKATGHLDEAYKLVVRYKLQNDDLAATVMNNMAVLLTAQGKFHEAIDYYQRAYEIKRTTYGDESVLLMDLSSNMAVVYWAIQQPEKALPLFQKSIALAIRQIRYIFPNLSEDEQVQFYKKLKEDFERFNTIAFQSSEKNPELLTQVFNHQIIIKSLIFFTQQKRAALIGGQADSLLIKQYNLLKEKRNQLGHLYQLSRRELSAAGFSTNMLEGEIDALEKAISLKTSETVAEKMQATGITWQDIQRRMQPDDALIEVIRFRKYDFKTFQEDLAGRVNFGFTDSVYYAALVTTRETTTQPKPVLMKHGTNMENRLAIYYKNALRFSVDDEYSYASYWKALEPAVQNKRKVYFSGDGIYHKVNLNTLRDPQTGKFLIERYDIHYLLNAGQYIEERKNTFTNHHAVLIGDPVFDVRQPAGLRHNEKYSPLPGTHTEIFRIDEILKKQQWTAEVYVKKAATERNLLNVASPGILHIATHGFFLPDVVTLGAKVRKDFLFHSGLILSGAAENPGEGIDAYQGDGVVTAYEVMNLDLAETDLVVLSACETALGKIENGEGVYGLQRSFLQAGARNIMISLWKVDDQYTQELMIKFYQYLFAGKSKREALQAAQLDLFHAVRDPLYWGAFIMVGVD